MDLLLPSVAFLVYEHGPDLFAPFLVIGGAGLPRDRTRRDFPTRLFHVKRASQHLRRHGHWKFGLEIQTLAVGQLSRRTSWWIEMECDASMVK